MSGIFEAYMAANTDLEPEAIKRIRALAVSRKLRKRQFLLQEGDVCRHKIFVCNGLLRAYRLKEDGTEHIMRFSPENTWAIDHYSYNNQLPAQLNIEALEPTEVLLWTKENFDVLMNEIPALRFYSDKLKEHSLDASTDRILKSISYTTEEKYEDFIATFPDVFRRVPLHMVASYLGVSRETLSRIRRNV